jgi:hypothetical protein
VVVLAQALEDMGAAIVQARQQRIAIVEPPRRREIIRNEAGEMVAVQDV